MAGGQVTYEFGYCPYNYRPYCCAVTVSLLSHAWNLIRAHVAVKRLPMVSTLAVAFRLKSMSQQNDISQSENHKKGFWRWWWKGGGLKPCFER